MITAQEVADWAGIELDPQHALVVSAVNQYVASLPSIDLNEDGTWQDTTRLGAILLGARMYRRKNSPGGIEAAGDTVTFVSRYDSDISRLLNLDQYKMPMVG